MARLDSIIPGGFNSQAVAPQAPQGEPLPPGIYDVEITSAEIKDAKSGNGTGLKLEYTVVGPTHANRKIFQYINLRHTNSQAEQIGQSQLSALCRAVGIVQLDDTDHLFGRMLRVKVKVRPAEGQYEASNDVMGYEANGSAPAPSGPAAVAAVAPKAAPWAKKVA